MNSFNGMFAMICTNFIFIQYVNSDGTFYQKDKSYKSQNYLNDVVIDNKGNIWVCNHSDFLLKAIM